MNKELLDLILAQLAEDFPDTAKTYSAEVFADWLTDLSKQYMEAFNTPQHNSTITAEFRRAGLSPTGRFRTQPRLQHLPVHHLKYGDFLELGQEFDHQLKQSMTQERAQELLQQYRDTFPDISAPWLTPGHYPNFPCVAVDLASGVDYSVEQHPIQADHASVDDKGNVTWHGIRRGVFSSKGHPQNLPKYNPPRPVGANPLLGAPYGNRFNKEMSGPAFRATLEEVRQQTWGNMTPDDIYKDISGMLLRQQADEEYNRRAVENGLQQEWVHLLDGRVSSYVPADHGLGAVFSTGRFEDGNMFVETMDKGKEAVTLARAYLLRLVKLEPKQ